MIETAQNLGRRKKRRTHKAGWQVSRRELRELESQGRRFKRWEVLVLTPEGKLILFLQIYGLWGNKWQQVVTPNEEILERVAAFLGMPSPTEAETSV